MRSVFVCTLAALLQVSLISAAEPVETPARWDGKVQDRSHQKLAPESGVISDAKSWKTLWETWRPGEKLPPVNFEKDIVVVGVVSGPNRVLLRPTLTENGDLRFIVAGTRMAGPGFGYALVRVGREGVNTVNGKPIANTAEAKSALTGTVVIPADLASFDKQTLEVKLWQYDRRLADVSADLFAEMVVKGYSHEAGTETKTTFELGKPDSVREDRAYYLTVFVTQNGKRTHMGEKDGKRGLCKVLNRGNPATVEMIVRAVGR